MIVAYLFAFLTVQFLAGAIMFLIDVIKTGESGLAFMTFSCLGAISLIHTIRMYMLSYENTNN